MRSECHKNGALLPQTKLAELAEQLQESQAKLAEAQDSLAMERDGVAALRSEVREPEVSSGRAAGEQTVTSMGVPHSPGENLWA